MPAVTRAQSDGDDVPNQQLELDIILPGPQTVTELGSLTANCTVINNSTEVDFRWSKLGDDDFEVFDMTLYLSQITIDMAGVYRCEVRTRETPPKFVDKDMEVIVHCK